MICFHDWRVHKQPYDYNRAAYNLLKDDFFVYMIAVITAMTNAMAFGAIAERLWDIIPLNIVVGLAAGVITFSSIWWEASRHTVRDYNPWAPADKTCLKCGKMKFNATKYEHKKDIRQGKKAKVDAIRMKQILEADKRYSQIRKQGTK